MRAYNPGYSRAPEMGRCYPIEAFISIRAPLSIQRIVSMHSRAGKTKSFEVQQDMSGDLEEIGLREHLRRLSRRWWPGRRLVSTTMRLLPWVVIPHESA